MLNDRGLDNETRDLRSLTSSIVAGFTEDGLSVEIGDAYFPVLQFSSVQSFSRVQLCDPMNRSTPGLPVHRQLPEFTQTHVH